MFICLSMWRICRKYWENILKTELLILFAGNIGSVQILSALLKETYEDNNLNNGKEYKVHIGDGINLENCKISQKNFTR